VRAGRFTLFMTALWITLSVVDLTACGDKFIRLAARLGSTYQARNRATVLLYLPPGSAAPVAAQSLKLKQRLEQAGHRVYAIDREADLQAALAVRPYDIVVADAPASAALSPLLQRAAGRPTFLPIFAHQSKQELASARDEHGCLIAAREKPHYAVAEIDHVMEKRRATRVAP
jgi:hypothetical protein